MSMKMLFAHIDEFSSFELADVKRYRVFIHTLSKQYIDALQHKYADLSHYKSLGYDIRYLYNIMNLKTEIKVMPF